MSGISFSSEGDFRSIKLFFKRLMARGYPDILKKYGEIGVARLRATTPKRTGKTSDSWYYEISRTSEGYELSWNNSNVSNGVRIAILIQYGHGTRGATWVEGRDYINPALRPVFDQLSQELRGGI